MLHTCRQTGDVFFTLFLQMQATEGSTTTKQTR